MEYFNTIYNYYKVDGISKADAESMAYIAVREQNEIYEAAVTGTPRSPRERT